MTPLGQAITERDHSNNELKILVEKNRVVMHSFVHPEYKRHSCQLLKGAILPAREVEDFEIYHVDRKFFNGETAMKMCETLLGIDC